MRADACWRRLHVLALALLLPLATPLWAQPPPSAAAVLPIPYSSLSASEREQLQPFAADWDQLPPERQARLRRAAARWAQMTPEQRTQMQERQRRWQALPPEKKAELRQRFQDFRRMSPEQQERVRRGQERFRQLPPEERARLREEFQRMAPPERRAFLQGAAAERHALARERWLQSLPEAEREPMRAMLDGLAPDQRKAFRRLLMDTPPEQREALRREFLDLDPAARAQRLLQQAPPPRRLEPATRIPPSR